MSLPIAPVATAPAAGAPSAPAAASAALGPAAPRPPSAPPPLPWSLRLRDALSSYLPLLLMGALALASWWLVKNTPGTDAPHEPAAARHDPDYLMQRFTLQRFAADGRLTVQVEGDQARHYPDTDTLEIDSVRIRAWSADGAVLNANARRALVNGDATEVQLLGGAHVQREGGRAAGNEGNAGTVTFDSEFMHAFLATERLRTHLPVVMRQGTSEIHAGGVDYDNLDRKADFKGPVRARFAPRR